MKQLLIIGTLGLSSFALGQSLSLSTAVEKAFANRPSIKSAQMKLDSARNSARALGAFPSTQLGIGQSTRAELGATDMDMFVSQSLDIFGRSKSNRKIGEAEVHKAEAQLRQTKLDIQSSVVTQYFEAVTATKVRASAESLQDLSQSLLQATQRRFEEGKIPEVQVTRARLEFERSQQTLLLRESQLQAALTRLRGVIGELVTLEDLDVTTSLAPNPQAQLDQRPDIQILFAELEAAQAKSRAAQKSNLPELELIGLRSPWRSGSTQFGARLQLTWNFNDFGKQNHEVKALQLEVESLQKSIEDAQLSAGAEVKAIELDIQASRVRVESYRELLEINRTLVAKSQLGFEQGVGTLIDVLEASRSLRELEQEISEAELAFNLATVAFYTTTGTLLEETN